MGIRLLTILLLFPILSWSQQKYQFSLDSCASDTTVYPNIVEHEDLDKTFRISFPESFAVMKDTTQANSMIVGSNTSQALKYAYILSATTVENKGKTFTDYVTSEIDQIKSSYEYHFVSNGEFQVRKETIHWMHYVDQRNPMNPPRYKLMYYIKHKKDPTLTYVIEVTSNDNKDMVSKFCRATELVHTFEQIK